MSVLPTIVTRALGLVLAVGLFAGPARGQTTANFARNQFVTAGAFQDTFSPPYATDGKVGPENRLVTRNGGRHRLNVFFDEAVTIGSVHVYSMGYGGESPVDSFDVFYFNDSGLFVPAPGASVVGNT
ncbi:MAG: hypothetical protein AAF085_14880, partial [Planctomycetota bacterium]